MVTIHISNEDLDRIMRWNLNNEHRRIATSGKFPYSNFRLCLTDDVMGEYEYDVSLVDNDVQQGTALYFCGKEKDVFVICNNYKQVNDDFKNIQDTRAKDYKTHRRMIWGAFIMIMAYIQHKLSRRKALFVESKGKSNNHASKVNRTVNKGKKEVFLLDDFVVYEHKESKGGKHNITCPSWQVKGHYRHYKSGKVVWVRECSKGKEKDKIKNIDIYLNKSVDNV